MLNSRENNGFFLFCFHDISFISASDVLECKNVVCAWMCEGPKSMNFCRSPSTFAVNASEANANLVIEEILTREPQYKQIAPSNDTSNTQTQTRTQRIMEKKRNRTNVLCLRLNQQCHDRPNARAKKTQTKLPLV